jgi:hypothetical protein
VKNSEDGWSLVVEYTKRKLPDGTTTMVAAAGQRKERGRKADPGTDLFIKATLERTAMSILEDCDPPEMTRVELAKAVRLELDPDLEQNEPEMFDLDVRNLARQLGRLSDGELFRFAAKRGTGRKQEILSFAKPDRGRRVGRPKL